ncbi:MAG TPA: acyloxyacyl hydrolase [Chthoniobacterales bacterium]
MTRNFLVAISTILFLLRPAIAGETSVGVTRTDDIDARFDGGRMEVALMAGAAGAPVLGPGGISYIYTATELRAGWMLYTPHRGSWLSGNFEVFGMVGGGGMLRGFGSYVVTSDLLLRYNFVQPGARIVPYLQAGAGVFYSDISQHHQQEDIGNTIEADLRGGPGVKFLLNAQWSIDTEMYIEHISNAGTSDRNVGINSLGGLIGVSRAF